MKIVAVSKENLSTENDILIAENVTDSNLAMAMIQGINKSGLKKNNYNYTLVGDDYNLYKWNY
jgi:hypothetical protein